MAFLQVTGHQLLLRFAVHHHDGLLHQRTERLFPIFDGEDLGLGFHNQGCVPLNDLATAISFSPSAGATRFILYSTVRTEALVITVIVA